jgi:hypothetical protein
MLTYELHFEYAIISAGQVLPLLILTLNSLVV